MNKKNDNKTIISLAVDYDLYERINKISDDFGLSKSAFIRMIILKYVNEIESKKNE